MTQISNRWPSVVSLLRGLLGITVIVALFTGVLTIAMLTLGHITAPTWINRAVETRLSPLLDNYSFELGEILLSFDVTHVRPKVTMTEASLAQDDGAMTLDMSDIDFNIDWWDLVSKREFNVRSVIVNSTSMTSNRPLNQGQVDPSLPQTTMTQFGILATAAMAHFDSVQFLNLEALITPMTEKKSIQLTGGVMDVVKKDSKIALSARLNWDDARLRLTASTPTDSDALTAQFQLTKAQPHLLSTFVDLPDWIQNSPQSFALQVNMQSHGEGDLPQTYWQAEAEPPESNSVAQDQSRYLIAFSSNGSFDQTTKRLTIDKLLFGTTLGSGRVDGYLDGLIDSQGELTSIQGHLRLNDGEIKEWKWFPKDLSETISAEANFQFDVPESELKVAQMSLNAGETRMEIKGRAIYRASRWDSHFQFDVDNLNADQLTALWPRHQKPSQRWLKERLKEGQIMAASGAVVSNGDEETQIFANFQFKNVELEFIKDFPMVSDATGYGVVENDSLLLHFDEGFLQPAETEEGGRVNLVSADISLTDLTSDGPEASVDLVLDGSMSPFLAMLNQNPLNLFETLPIDKTFIEGQVKASGQIEFPLRRGLNIDAIKYKADIDFHEIKSRELRGGQLTADLVTVTVDNERVLIQGDGQYRGIPLTATWQHEFDNKKTDYAPITGRVEVSAEAINQFDISISSNLIRGRQMADFFVTIFPNQTPEFGITTDAKDLNLTIPGMGIEKPVGEVAQIILEGRFSEPLEVTRVSITGAGFELEGGVKFKPEGGILQSEFRTARFGQWLDIEGVYQSDGDYVFEITGGEADFSQAARTKIRRGTVGSLDKPVRLQLDKVRLTPSNTLNEVNGTLLVNNEVSGEFVANLNNQVPTRALLTIGNQTTELRLESDNAGDFLRSTGLLPNLYGGDIALKVTREENEGDSPLRFITKIVNVRARKIPPLGELLGMVSIIGLVEQLDGDGIVFSEVQAEVWVTDDQFEIRRAFASGPSLGMTLEGTISRVTGEMDLKGVMTPLNLANEILMVTPLRALGIDKGDGIGAISYFVRGSNKEPVVGANPLSILTPGIFKNIFQ